MEHFQAIPSKLTTYLMSHEVYRRRAVITGADREFKLLCCTVEALPSEGGCARRPSQRYRQCLLLEDWLSARQCLEFATELDQGKVALGDTTLIRAAGTTSQWSVETVPLDNHHMLRAGCVVSARFPQSGSDGNVGPLLAVNAAYYPDLDQAARDWLPFSEYHGTGDGRNSQVVFLLPETRAFVDTAQISDAGLLEIALGGTAASELSFRIQGAYWMGKAIHHFESPVSKLRAHVAVPLDADRLDYFLVDQEANVYDFHREDRRFPSPAGRILLTKSSRPWEQQVREAVSEGEGVRTEFKPFVDPKQPLTTGHSRTKLGEIVTTVVAFANAEGGAIYLGVEDDCTISGIDAGVGRWAKAAAGDEHVQNYLAVLNGKIRDAIQGAVNLDSGHVRVNGVVVAVIRVAPSTNKPACVVGDNYLYVRKGATNRKVPPDQWRSILMDGPDMRMAALRI
jgi:hypothetical protein